MKRRERRYLGRWECRYMMLDRLKMPGREICSRSWRCFAHSTEEVFFFRLLLPHAPLVLRTGTRMCLMPRGAGASWLPLYCMQIEGTPHRTQYGIVIGSWKTWQSSSFSKIREVYCKRRFFSFFSSCCASHLCGIYKKGTCRLRSATERDPTQL